MSKTQKIVVAGLALMICGGALGCVHVTVPLGIVTGVAGFLLFISAPLLADL